MSEGPKFKKSFYVAVGVVVLGLLLLASYQAGWLAPKGKDEGKIPELTKEDLAKVNPKQPQGAEAADPNAPTTVKEYTFVSEAKLPAVTGVSSYKKLDNNTVRMALNVWAGWAPVVWANGGFKPRKEWVTADGKKFKLELVLIDDPVAMRDAYASGNIHIGWATLDMLPLLLEELRKDSRTMPRVYQQIDWSNGGDGIVGRGAVKSIGDLKGKTVVLAQNSPSQYFVLNALISGGVQPSDVKFKYTADAFQAAAAFAADKNIAACVSWAPDIYKLSEVKGNQMIVSTLQANRLIADVWFARADFAKDHPEIVEALVRGFLDATDDLQAQDKKEAVAKLLAEGYNMPAADALGMLGDAHWTNYAENRDFFLNQNNPTNFERTWDTANFLYARIGKVTTKTTWDQVADFSVIKKLGEEAKYAASLNNYQVQFVPKSVDAIQAESGEILTKTVKIHFFPNSDDLGYKVIKQVGDKQKEELYDPNAPNIIEEVGKMAGQFGASRIVIEGHTDSSMKGTVQFSDVEGLSQRRAAAVKAGLLAKFPTIDPNQISTSGVGWNRPADPADPGNHAKNRRVEVKVYPLEAE